MVTAVPNRNETETVTIPAGGSLSGAVDIRGRFITGILMPSAWTAANITLSVSIDGVTYADLADVAGEYVITAAAGRFVGLNVASLMGFRYVKVRSGTSGTPVVQAADRNIVLTLGDFTY